VQCDECVLLTVPDDVVPADEIRPSASEQRQRIERNRTQFLLWQRNLFFQMRKNLREDKTVSIKNSML
jgi:hypothetical protein